MIKTIAISCVCGVFLGVGISYLAHTKHKPEVVTKTEVKTETQTVYEQLPSKIVYKDKVRTIKMDCPSVKVADTKETVVRQASVASVPDKKTSVKVSIYPDWYHIKDRAAHKVGIEASYNGWGIELESTSDFKHVTTGFSYSF